MPTLKEEGVPFEITIIGETTGTTWSGKFRTKDKLSFRDQISIDKIRRELLGKDLDYADPEVVAEATMISELSVRIVDSPAFWKESKGGLELFDANLLVEVYKKAMEAQKAAQAEVQKAGEQARDALRQVRKDQEDADKPK